jgi:phenylacetate-coenzyme A ligase PaaK-like adenylate-forming protein
VTDPLVSTRDRLADFAVAVRRSRALAERARWPRERLDAWTRQAMAAVVAHAHAHSPFHAARITSDAVPAMTKADLMANWDGIVTDRRITIARAEAHLDALDGDRLLDGRYRVMASGGTSGTRGVFLYDRDEWRTLLAGLLRGADLLGRPRRPGWKIATLLAPSPVHSTWRFAASSDIGLYRVCRVDPRASRDEQLAALQAFGPDEISGYPSALAPLAVAGLDGQLAITPRLISTAGEVRTPEVTRLIEQAWNVTPHNMYGTTEGGVLGIDCTEHAGIHISEDLILPEILDADGRPVRDGEPGQRLLITSLVGRTLPLIRYELGDVVTATREPCACGRTLLRITDLQGRRDDALRLPASGGGTMTIHAIAVRSPMATVTGLQKYQIIHGADGIHVRVHLRSGAPAGTLDEIHRRIHTALIDAGAAPPPIRVAERDDFIVTGIGKHRLVIDQATTQRTPSSAAVATDDRRC